MDELTNMETKNESTEVTTVLTEDTSPVVPEPHDGSVMDWIITGGIAVFSAIGIYSAFKWIKNKIKNRKKKGQATEVVETATEETSDETVKIVEVVKDAEVNEK